MEMNKFERTFEELRKVQAARQVAEQLMRKREHLPDSASVSRAAAAPRRESTRSGVRHGIVASSEQMDQIAAVCIDGRRSELRLPTYDGAEALNAYLAQVELATGVSGWSPAETTVRVALSLEGEALRVLEDLGRLRPEDAVPQPPSAALSVSPPSGFNSPLHEITKKNKPFRWDNVHAHASAQLRAAAISSPRSSIQSVRLDRHPRSPNQTSYRDWLRETTTFSHV